MSDSIATTSFTNNSSLGNSKLTPNRNHVAIAYTQSLSNCNPNQIAAKCELEKASWDYSFQRQDGISDLGDNGQLVGIFRPFDVRHLDKIPDDIDDGDIAFPYQTHLEIQWRVAELDPRNQTTVKTAFTSVETFPHGQYRLYIEYVQLVGDCSRKSMCYSSNIITEEQVGHICKYV